MVVVRSGLLMVIGFVDEGNYVVFDFMVINVVIEKFIFLEEGDIVVLFENKVIVYDCNFLECECSMVI